MSTKKEYDALVAEIEENIIKLSENLRKAKKGNLAAMQRTRTTSVDLAKQFKPLRKLSVILGKEIVKKHQKKRKATRRKTVVGKKAK